MCIRIGSAGDFQGSCKNGCLVMELVNTVWMFLNEVSIPPPHFVHNGHGVHCQRKSPTVSSIVLFLLRGLKYLSFLYMFVLKNHFILQPKSTLYHTSVPQHIHICSQGLHTN
jgi:hypothetical protein